MKKVKTMTNVVSALTARTQLGQILARVSSKNERFVVDRRGQPQAIIMSIRDYVDLFAPTPDWLKAIGEESKKKGLNKLTMRQIDSVIADTRKERRKKASLTTQDR